MTPREKESGVLSNELPQSSATHDQSGSTVLQLEQDQTNLGVDTPQLLNTVRLYSTGDRLPDGRDAIETHSLDAMGQSEKLQRPDTEPVEIELIPTQTMTS